MAPTTTSEYLDKLWLEQSINTAGYLGAISYDLHVAVYFASTYFLLVRRKPRPSRWKLHIFNTFVFALGTIHIATTIRFDQLAWILERGYEGGPYAFLLHEQYRPVSVLGLSAASLANFMLDGLLLWRTWVIWGNKHVLLLPALLYIATIVLSTANIVQSAHPYVGTWGPNLGLACWTMSMSLNILLSFLLAARLLWQRRKLHSLGLAEKPAIYNHYTGVASMVIESALLTNIVSCVFIILYAKQNTAENLLVPMMLQVTCISPQLILIQVYRGRAWTRTTVDDATRLSSFKFGHQAQPEAAASGELAAQRALQLQSRQYGSQSDSLVHSDTLSMELHFAAAPSSQHGSEIATLYCRGCGRAESSVSGDATQPSGGENDSSLRSG